MNENWQTERKTNSAPRLTVMIVSVIAAFALAIGGVAGLMTANSARAERVSTVEHSSKPTRSSAPIVIRPTAAQLAEFRKLTATPAQRDAIVKKMQAAFAGIAQVGVGPMPTSTAPSGSAVLAVSNHSPPSIEDALAIGKTSDHFWVIASYLDIAHGAISVAVYYCKAYGVPGWICDAGGYLLRTLSNGWGYASNHGVWGAFYWWPPYVTGGRW